MKKLVTQLLIISTSGLIGFSGAPARGAVESLSLKSTDAFPAPRWMYGNGNVPTGNEAWALMAGAKYAQMNSDPDTCLQKIDKAWAKARDVRPWLAVNELNCGMKLKEGTSRADRLHRSLGRVEKNVAWLLDDPAADSLRTAVITAYLLALEQDVKTNRARAASTIDRVEELIDFADEGLRARFWRLAGELAYLQQNGMAARNFLRRSLREVESDETRTRLNQVESTLEPEVRATPEPDSKAQNTGAGNLTINPLLEASKEELDLVDRVTSSLKNGELISAVDDALKIMRQFSGGVRAKWAAERILEAYNNVAEKSDAKYLLTKSEMLKRMLTADSDRMADWAKTLYARGQWEDALVLAKQALLSLTGTRAEPTLDVAAKSAMAGDQFAVARVYFDILVREHAGTALAREALFRSGLLHFRMKEFGLAASDFERLLATNPHDRFEIGSRYWFWRSLQRAGMERADVAADELMKKFPFSYYGLRARMERTANVLEWPSNTQPIATQLWITGGQHRAWDRALLLMRAGWFDEAEHELQQLPPPIKPEDKAVRAVIWAAIMRYVNASNLANEAWDAVPDLRRDLVVRSAFPNEFMTSIEDQAANRKLDRFLVQSLIKQESSYNVRAVSSSSAYGLMQMIPATAREIASELKLGALAIPDDLFQPARNIQMGTYYLAKLVNRYSGHVPLALASYNAGPTRIDRWLKNRASLKGLAQSRSSRPEDELWFDELPYAETSGYVKSILRNILIYKMLDQGRVQISDPVWAANEAVAH